MKLIIKESEWLNADTLLIGENSCLLSPTSGRMCCLGFAVTQLGDCKKPDIEDCPTPEDLHVAVFDDKLDWLLNHDGSDSLDCQDLVSINDAKEFTHEERKARISRVFGKHNIEVVYEP